MRTLTVEPGFKIGKLTAIKFHSLKGTAKHWLFKCDCGKDHVTSLSRVLNGNTRSCGCLKLPWIRGRY